MFPLTLLNASVTLMCTGMKRITTLLFGHILGVSKKFITKMLYEILTLAGTILLTMFL